ncbi:hypothetical protein EMIHUDRAFT_115862 [Emiliania huxleyi CCMP1516]|uniref:Cell division cycle protein 123 n=2 Tax=Emiliania huxleyi TaxID=2903 RepID=A0A0D3JLU9_EMIH1|nr:hypothetical protein EMIHUDRAFT_115862 [Emiliania huxleyi CCMP1516]EOD24484.1 hypothetical protein EMIHUDRAFT_115862 [Emiliania huxleyi CCMP1516]|eukprot:XP_005776913.1 hypothetical protein EMIHUDRAFT_115862 [Emiliania huxleyi CCMP1516]
MLSSDLLSCGIDRWYPDLRRLTIRSVLVPLPSDFAAYLVADGVVLPGGDDEAGASPAGEEADDESADGSATLALPASFEAVRRAIDDGIERLGGAVFVKLNWSAPRDAAWVLGGSLKCTSSEDVLLLLQSSDRAAHDLTEARRMCEDAAAAGEGGAGVDAAGEPHGFVLALRKWCELQPSREFRCFRGAGGRLLAACQRDRFSHFPELGARRSHDLGLLEAFGRELPSAPARVVWDAYVDRNDKVHLVDLAPFHESTDPLLFEWEELVALDDAAASPPQLRLVAEGHIAPSASIYNGWPQELQQLGQQDLESLIQTAQKAAKSADS